jgi:hypothetical protein
MNKFYQMSVLMLLVTFMTFLACKKQNESGTISSDSEINSLADLAMNGLETQGVYSDNPDKGIYMKNEGIPSDFLVEESDLTGKDTLRQNIRDHSFIACLRGLNLAESQISEVKQNLRDYRGCKENAMQRAKAIYRDLHEKYMTKYKRIYAAFQNGTISKEKFKTLVVELKVEFRRELRSLQLKEKLGDAFKSCFRIFLKDLHSVLTEIQWNAFVECYKR